jgi:aryl-alcohol dehydrogenase-like predicted oxidoreductase
VLARPEVTSAIVGARRPGQIQVSAPAGDLQLTPEIMAQIEPLLAERDKDLEAAGAIAAESLR